MTKFLAEVTGRARSGVLLRPELLLLGGGRGGGWTIGNKDLIGTLEIHIQEEV